MHATALPLWAFALAAAAVAPFCARALANAFERRARERTLRALGAVSRIELQRGAEMERTGR